MVASFLRAQLVCVIALALACLGGCAPPPDTASSVPESQWFAAEEHLDAAKAWVQAWSGERTLHLLDLFGASQSMSRQWRRRGFRAAAYDIQLTAEQDVCTEQGFYALVDLALQLLPGGLIFGGPPCSLYVGASASIHRRRAWRLEGDVSQPSVRLSNRIWRNFAVAMKLVMEPSRSLFFIFEQPSQSWGFKQTYILELKHIASMICVLTYMAYFQHDLCKPTHLLGNLRSLASLKRTLSKKDRLKFRERLEKRNLKRVRPRIYYKARKKSDGTVGWQGCRDLATSATYTASFCQAVWTAWAASQDCLAPPPKPVIEIV